MVAGKGVGSGEKLRVAPRGLCSLSEWVLQKLSDPLSFTLPLPLPACAGANAECMGLCALLIIELWHNVQRLPLPLPPRCALRAACIGP